MIDTMPPEVRAHVLLFLESGEDLITLRCVSKLWLEMTEAQELWKSFCLNKHRVFRMELFDDDWRKCYLHMKKTSNFPINRLVIHALNGNYFTISPDGTDTSEITTDQSESSKYYGQATWSTHCDSIAIAQYRVNSHKSNILIYNVKEQKITERYETPQHPFYFYWSPDSTRLTFLSNWPTHSIAMHYIDVAKDPTLKLIGAGRPYYYSFDPSGAPRVVSHFALGYMEIINLDSLSRKDVMHSESLSSFSSPYWISDREILYVYRSPQGDMEENSLRTRLVCATIDEPLTKAQLQSMPREELEKMLRAKSVKYAEEEDLAAKVYTQIVEKTILCHESVLAEIDVEDTEVDFVSSPNSRYVAFSDGSLHLVDLNEFKSNKDYKPVLIHRFAVAFFWSPNSRYLLFISQSSRVDIFSHHYLWWMYDTQIKECYQLTGFSASAEFRQHYLPFYCQYAQSLTFFSPDSRHFVYVNDKTVNICGVEKDSTPRFLCHGTFATWSPC